MSLIDFITLRIQAVNAMAEFVAASNQQRYAQLVETNPTIVGTFATYGVDPVTAQICMGDMAEQVSDRVKYLQR
jgi:hypothetical protein